MIVWRNFMCKRNSKLGEYTIKQIKKYAKQEIISVLLTTCYSASVVATPYLTRYLIDSFTIALHVANIWKLIIVFLAACFIQPIFSYCGTKILQAISENIILNTRFRLFWNILHAPMLFFHENSTGAIVSRLTNDSQKLGDLLLGLISSVFKDALFVVLILVGMYLFSPIVAISVLLLLFVYVGFNIFFNSRLEARSKKVLENNDNFYKVISQGINNIENIKTAALEQKIYEEFSSILNDFKNNRLKLFGLYNFTSSFSATIEVFSIGIIYCVGFLLISKHKLTVGGVVAFDIYFQMMMPSIRRLLLLNSNYHEIAPALKRLDEYLALSAEDDLQSRILNNNNPCVCFENVFFSYSPKNNLILKDTSFCLNTPGLYCLVGKSGSGKSTIAKLILGLYKPTAGQVLVDVGGKQVYNLRKGIAYASQNMPFFNKTIRYNLTLGTENITDEELIAICKKLDLHDTITNLPNGYDELITEKLNLSGGEIQRLNLARVFLQKKAINILDEITSALDSGNALLAKSVIEELAKTSLVLLITHNKNLIQNAKQIYALENGRIKKEIEI